jgi:putative addiction module component (TIGR02574 family)
MSPSLQDLGIAHLSIEERLSIAQIIWDSVEADLERVPLTNAQRAELERRLLVPHRVLGLSQAL